MTCQSVKHSEHRGCRTEKCDGQHGLWVIHIMPAIPKVRCAGDRIPGSPDPRLWYNVREVRIDSDQTWSRWS